MTKFLADREKGFEAEFRRNQELAFKVTARRNRLFGLWAAARLGVTGSAAEAYAVEVVEADFEAPGDEDVISKVLGDFKARGITMTDAELRTELARASTDARQQLASR